MTKTKNQYYVDEDFEPPPPEPVPELGPVIEPLTPEEAALAAILLDESGVDQAEFLWDDQTKADLCYRLHPYQWPWWRDRSERQIDQCSRDVGKSESMMARVLAFPFSFPNQEMAIVTPESSHIDTIAERIEARIKRSWFYNSLTRPGRSGVTHRPFKILWANGARILSRLPQRSGIGVKGVHATRLEIDEAQDLTRATWREIPETVRWDVEGARWYIHGVSKGIRDDFYDYSTQPEKGFTVHRLTKMHKPDWSPEERAQSIAEYGGSMDSPDYKRNVKGEHGDTAHLIFHLERLMRCTDTDESSDYNLNEYFKADLRNTEVQARAEERDAGAGMIHESNAVHAAVLREMLDFPAMHKQKYQVFWAGMDVGLVADPSEILVFAEYHPEAAERRRDKNRELAIPPDGLSRMKLLTRISMRELPAPLQVEVVLWVVEHYQPKAFAMDSSGNGLPVFQELQKRAAEARARVADLSDDTSPPIVAIDRHSTQQAMDALTTIKGYNFSGKAIVAFDEAKLAELPAGADAKDMADMAGIRRYVKDAGTDALRALVDTSRMLLPYDKELLATWNGQTWHYSAQAIDAYGRRRSYSSGSYHVLDAGRMAALGWELDPIERLLNQPPKKAEPVLDFFG